MVNKKKKKRTYFASVWEQLKKPPTLIAIIISLSGIIIVNIILPYFKERSDHISLSAQIVTDSVVMIDSTYLNLELKAEIKNYTSHNLKIKEFLCYRLKHNILTKIGLSKGKDKIINVSNFCESEDNTYKNTFPPKSSGEFHVYINVPVPDLIDNIKKYIENNNYYVTYSQLKRDLTFTKMDILLEVTTNPEFKDNTTIHLFETIP